jgi:hypothetical protein
MLCEGIAKQGGKQTTHVIFLAPRSWGLEGVGGVFVSKRGKLVSMRRESVVCKSARSRVDW